MFVCSPRSGCRMNGSPKPAAFAPRPIGAVISEDEAIEILMNVRRLAEGSITCRRGEGVVNAVIWCVFHREQREG